MKKIKSDNDLYLSDGAVRWQTVGKISKIFNILYSDQDYGDDKVEKDLGSKGGEEVRHKKMMPCVDLSNWGGDLALQRQEKMEGEVGLKMKIRNSVLDVLHVDFLLHTQ